MERVGWDDPSVISLPMNLLDSGDPAPMDRLRRYRYQRLGRSREPGFGVSVAWANSMEDAEEVLGGFLQPQLLEGDDLAFWLRSKNGRAGQIVVVSQCC